MRLFTKNDLIGRIFLNDTLLKTTQLKFYVLILLSDITPTIFNRE